MAVPPPRNAARRNRIKLLRKSPSHRERRRSLWQLNVPPALLVALASRNCANAVRTGEGLRIQAPSAASRHRWFGLRLPNLAAVSEFPLARVCCLRCVESKMSDRARYFLNEWLGKHIAPLPAVERLAASVRLALQCRHDATAAGIPLQEIRDAVGGDLIRKSSKLWLSPRLCITRPRSSRRPRHWSKVRRTSQHHYQCDAGDGPVAVQVQYRPAFVPPKSDVPKARKGLDLPHQNAAVIDAAREPDFSECRRCEASNLPSAC